MLVGISGGLPIYCYPHSTSSHDCACLDSRSLTDTCSHHSGHHILQQASHNKKDNLDG